MSDACVHDAGFFPDGRTDGRTDKPILGVGCQPVLASALVALAALVALLL